MSNLIKELALQAGIKHIEGVCRIGGRGYLANETELTNFAKLVGQRAREHERTKIKENKQ